MKYEIHPAANLFPMMPDAELKELADDIKAKGLIHPVILLRDQVLDGRNRLKACEMADVQPRFEIYADDRSPTEYVLATNLKRRQLTASQRATVAAGALPMLEQEAKERQKLSNENREKIPYSEKGKASEKAAEIADVNPRYVSDAKRLKTEKPEVFEEVARGEKTIPQAVREVWGPGGAPIKPADHTPEDDESDAVFGLKRYWKKANQKERKQFMDWAQLTTKNTKKGK